MQFFNLNLNEIINCHTAWPINKQLATKLVLQGTFRLHTFFDTLNDLEMDALVHSIDRINNDDHVMSELFLMTLMLSVAEGLDIDGDNDVELQQRFNSLISLIALESLHRRGLVEVQRENMSLGQDSGDLPIAKPTDAGRVLFKKLQDDDAV